MVSLYKVSGLLNEKLVTPKIFNSKIDIDDINTIKNYKYFFGTTDYNNIIDDLDHEKLSKIYIDNNFKQVVTVDNLPNTEHLYNHYHISDINPVVLPNLLEKSSQLHVPIYFTDFVSNNILNFNIVFKEIANVAGYVFPVLIVLSIISSIRNTISFQNQRMNFRNNLNGDPNNPLRNMFSKKEPESIKLNITLDNWAGSPEVIDECKEVKILITSRQPLQYIGDFAERLYRVGVLSNYYTVKLFFEHVKQNYKEIDRDQI
jgi:hypothetical protein